MAVTLKQIAEQCQISAAAVSMAINGKPGVSEETRALVLKTAAELGYRANQNGRSLRLARTGNIGVYFPSTVLEYSLYYAEVTRGIVAGLAPTDLAPVLLPSALETGDVRDFPAVDGTIIVEPHSNDLGMLELLRGDAPTVCVDPPPASAAQPWGIIDSETETSVLDALAHMRSRGSRRPGILTVERVSVWTDTLVRTYREWCLAEGIEPVVLHVEVQQSNDAVREQLRQALQSGPDACDGLFVCGDGFAARIAGVLRSLGLAAGEDIALVSGVDSTIMEFHTPPITSLDMNPFHFGQRAAQMMTGLLERTERPEQTLLERIDAPLIARTT